MDKDTIKVALFKDSKESFLSLLKENDIAYTERTVRPGVVMAAGETIEIIKALGEASLFPALATVIVQWLRARSSRKIIVQTKDKQVVHLQGYSVSDAERVLKSAESFSAIDTEPNKPLEPTR